MVTTPRPISGRDVERLVPLTGGGMNETYRVELPNDVAVIARIARQPVPWFTDEAHLMAQARDVGVPTPEVLGVEHLNHYGELLSFSIQRLLPGPFARRARWRAAALGSRAACHRRWRPAGTGHSVVADRGIRHRLQLPEETVVARVVRIVGEVLGAAVAAVSSMVLTSCARRL